MLLSKVAPSIDHDGVQTLIIDEDLCWRVVVRGKIVDLRSFTSAVLHTNCNSLASIKKVFELINACTLCCGNNDKSICHWFSKEKECVRYTYCTYTHALLVTVGMKQLAF